MATVPTNNFCQSRRVFSNYRGNDKIWEIARTRWKDYESTRSTNTPPPRPLHWWGRSRPWNKTEPHHAKWGVKMHLINWKMIKPQGRILFAPNSERRKHGLTMHIFVLRYWSSHARFWNSPVDYPLKYVLPVVTKT